LKPSKFEYFAPTDTSEVIALLSRYGDQAKLLAGGQSLVPLMNLRLADPAVLIDLNRVDGLAYIREEGGQLCIGAMTPHFKIEESDLVRKWSPMLAYAASLIGYPAIRHRGTIGGSLAHADPVSELPCIVRTLDAQIMALGEDGMRIIPAADFFDSFLVTALKPVDLLVEIRFPLQESEGFGWDFQEFARKTGDFALAAVAAATDIVGDTFGRVRIGLAGAASRPLRATEAEQWLSGRTIALDAITRAAEMAAAEVRTPSDAHASQEYRRHLVRVLAERALIRATGLSWQAP